jgi:hypothetical protein
MKRAIKFAVEFISNRGWISGISAATLLFGGLYFLVVRIHFGLEYDFVLAKYPIGLYVTDGRTILSLITAVLGILAYIRIPKLVPWLLGASWIWVNYFDPTLAASVGGRDIWLELSSESPLGQSLLGLYQTTNTFVLVFLLIASLYGIAMRHRQRVIDWIDRRGVEVAKNASDYEHTSPLAIVALILAFIFPIGALILAAIAKRDIALAKEKVGGVDLIVAANVIAVIFLVVQSLALLLWLNSIFQLTESTWPFS